MGISNFLVKLFGDKKSRDYKAYRPLVDAVCDIYPKISALGNDELRERVQEIRRMIAERVSAEREEIERIKAQIPETDIQDRAPLFHQIDKLEKDVLDKLEVVLDEVRAEVFAIVKSTAERFAKNADIRVKASDFDRELAAKHDFVDM